MLSYWQFPYSTNFRDPLTAQKRILLEAKSRLGKQAVPDSNPRSWMNSLKWSLICLVPAWTTGCS
jgi:hypothetical protein